jgi:uncharacterized protein (DUF302 family)
MPKLIVLAVLLIGSTARADAGLVEVASAHDVKETVSRLEAALARANVAVAAKIDHAAAAEKVGEQLPPTVLVVFGNPKLGTPLMHEARGLVIVNASWDAPRGSGPSAVAAEGQ